MAEKRRGLGRGLGALIPTEAPNDAGAGRHSPVDVYFPDQQPPNGNGAAETVSRETVTDAPAGDVPTGDAPDGADLLPVQGARFAEVEVDAITPNPRQPRQVFDEDAMNELASSIREIGLLQPIVVRELGDGRYELVMGERRWRATSEAGLATIPAIVRTTRDDDMLRDALLENLHRSELNPLEEAAAYQQLLDDFGCTHDELAVRIKRSRPQISNTLRLLKLPPLVQRRVAAGVLSAGHARALLGVSEGPEQERLAQRIVAEGLSVRSVEEIVAMGDGETPTKSRNSKNSAKPVAPRLSDIADALSERLDTRVRVDLGRSKGKVTIEFASIDDLERIVSTIGPTMNVPGRDSLDSRETESDLDSRETN
ncbi:ParB family chromosome partitioning protein [Haloactinopolyspora alba]|uniref:ParB family chromosome partitioning protein n=1 Tax=Haloactinopolyspora alba TaxID=648780 RepID=A0A2P8DVZ4_9ACTN|nr:ParB/RepB/Spo0J family partition protein [Haloactinopolyspora alba]PSL01392.1 ParB family chromosome partitioning protein [Haloactinopolyspora alba]